MKSSLLKTLSHGTGYGTIFCFPFAGGNSMSFRSLSQYFKTSKWDVVAFDPPGHGTNTEKLIDDINEMVSLYEEVILKNVSKPFVLLGHSLGGLITYLLTQRLEKKGHFPVAVFISAMAPPDEIREKKSDLTKARLLEYIKNMGGMPQELLENKEFQYYLIPILLADFKAIDDYKHTDQTLIKSPTYTFGGKADKGCSPELLSRWGNVLLQNELFLFDGGHMFLVDNPKVVAEKILDILNMKVEK